MTFSNINSNIPKIRDKEIDELIIKEPTEYIAPECAQVCKDLKKKNIYVLASVNVKKDLYLILDKLSSENMKIFKDKHKENSDIYCSNLGKEKYIGIKLANYLEQNDVEAQFEKIVEDFKMQDIQRGYLTEKTFLMNICNCEKVEGLTEYKKQDLQVVFDIKKMDKSFKEYLRDSGYEKFYIPEEHRIYLNDYYYQAHQNYINNKMELS